MVNRVVNKELAGSEDLLLGTGTVNQTRNGVTIPVTKIDASKLIYENVETLRTRLGKKVEVLTNVAALQALATSTVAEVYIYLLGYTTAGDGGGGLFWLDTTDTTSVQDLNIVFNPDNVANGRWKRVNTDSYMSPDRGDADYTITDFDFGIQQYGTTLTANRAVTLPTTGLYKGRRVGVLRTALGSFNLLIGSIATLTGKGLVELQFDGSTWVILTEPSTSSSSTVSGDSFNSSFENDDNNDNLPDNWSISELTSATIDIDKTDSAHGVNSLKFLSGGNGGGSAVSERFDVLSGSILPIEFTYKSSSTTSLNKVDVNTYDRNGTLLSTLPAYSEGVSNPTSYITKQVTVTLDATAVTAEIVITGIDASSTTKTAGTTTHFDNIRYTASANIGQGALVYNSSNQTIATSFTTVLLWDSEEYDDKNIHSTTSNTNRLVVPAGVSKVILRANIQWTGSGIGSSATTIDTVLYKNGAITARGLGRNKELHDDSINTVAPYHNIFSSILLVNEADYFELRTYQNSGSNFTIGSSSWFSMEIIE